MSKQTEFQRGVEAMRARVLETIQGWLKHSNAMYDKAAVEVLNALAGDVRISKVQK